MSWLEYAQLISVSVWILLCYRSWKNLKALDKSVHMMVDYKAHLVVHKAIDLVQSFQLKRSEAEYLKVAADLYDLTVEYMKSRDEWRRAVEKLGESDEEKNSDAIAGV